MDTLELPRDIADAVMEAAGKLQFTPADETDARVEPTGDPRSR
jgi:hypothetical protein